MGILPEDRAKLFCMFGRLESNSTLNPNGIGLGLNICKQIVQAFDGDIWVDDNYAGPGACFTFNVKVDSFECEEMETRVHNSLQQKMVRQAPRRKMTMECDVDSELSNIYESYNDTTLSRQLTT